MKNKNSQSIDEVFEFTTIEEIQDYVYKILDAVEQGNKSTPHAHLLNREKLSQYIQEIETNQYGRIWSGYGSWRNALTFYPCTYFSLSWYTLGTKQIRLIIGQNQPSITLSMPLSVQTKKALVELHIEREPKEHLGGLAIMADVFPDEYIKGITEPVFELLKQFPPLPAEVEKDRDFYEIWANKNGLLLIASYQNIIVGTPIGWIVIPKHTIAYHAAQKTKDPWRTLGSLGVDIPHLKKNRVWSDLMAAALAMYVLGQGGQ